MACFWTYILFQKRITSTKALSWPCFVFSKRSAFRSACRFMLAQNKAARRSFAEFGSDQPRYAIGTTGGKKGYNMQTNVSIIQVKIRFLRMNKISLIIARISKGNHHKRSLSRFADRLERWCLVTLTNWMNSRSGIFGKANPVRADRKSLMSGSWRE